MGFELNLLIVRPHYWNPHADLEKRRLKQDECEIWSTVSIINVDRVSAPVSKDCFMDLPAKNRAALHFVDSIWVSLEQAIGQRGLSCCAPEFCILPQRKDYDPWSVHAWREGFLESGNSQRVFIEPMYSGRYALEQIPRQYVMEEHNQALRDGVVSGRHFLSQRPLVWFGCEEVCQWTIQNQDRVWQRHHSIDPESSAYLVIWNTILEQMGRVGARCIFLFEGMNVTTVV